MDGINFKACCHFESFTFPSVFWCKASHRLLIINSTAKINIISAPCAWMRLLKTPLGLISMDFSWTEHFPLVWPPAHTSSTCRALTQPCPSASAMDWPQATEGQGCGGCPASAPSQAWPMALAHPCTPGYISTALQLGLSAQHCPHHGSLAHPGLGPVLLPRGSLGCDRK